MASRNDIERVVLLLQEMIEREDLLEKDYQKFFEENEFIFNLLGWGKVIPHPVLERANNSPLIPDFMVQGLDFNWEIFELKRPEASLLKNVEKRGGFYALTASYISQCYDYSEYFDDEQARRKFSEKYSTSINKRPKALLIVGRNIGLDRSELSKQEQRGRGDLRVQTFDDILNRLDFLRIGMYGDVENKSGLAMYFSFQLESIYEKGNAYITDIGSDLSTNRVTLFIDPQGFLTLRILDANSSLFEGRLTQSSDELLNRLVICGLEIAVAGKETIVLCEIDGLYVTEVKQKNLPLSFTWPLAVATGADMTGSAHSNFVEFRSLGRDKTFNLLEKELVRSWLAYSDGVSEQSAGGADFFPITGLRFGPGQFMYTQGHPMLARDKSSVTSNKTQENNECRPTLVERPLKII